MVVSRESIVYRLVAEVPAVVWVFLIAQVLVFGGYQIAVRDQLNDLRIGQHTQDIIIEATRLRVDNIYENGSSGLKVSNDRINAQVTRLQEIEKRVHELEGQVYRNNGRLDALERERRLPVPP